MRGYRLDLLLTGLLLVALMGAPSLLTNDYYVSTLTLAGINAIIAVGLSLLLGYAGQISLGHAAFYGLAAYATGILTSAHGWPMPAAMLTGVAVSGLAALLIGIPALKLKGHYLAMATLGFGLIVYIVFNETVEITGGPSGLTGIPRLELFGFAFESDLSYYRMVAGALVLAVLTAVNLIHSGTGRAMMAIHTSEKAAQSLGIDINRLKLLIFTLSAMFAGLAGVLYAHCLTFIAPASFGFHFSVQLMTMVVLGGMSSIWGAVIGAFFLSVLPEFLRVLEEMDILVYGAIMVLTMMFMPDGIVGGISRLTGLLRRLLRRTSTVPGGPVR